VANRKPIVLISGIPQAIPAADTLVDGSGTPYGTGTGSVTNVSSSSGDITVASPTTTPVLTAVSAPKWTTARTLSYTGNVTGSGSVDGSGNVATALTIGALQVATGMIQAGAVTYAKIQNVSANSVLLGAGAAGSGAAPVEITLGTNLSMSGTTLNATAGGSGTVTSVSSANGDLTVATPTTTPVLTIVSAPKLDTGRTISITGDLAYTSPSFDGSGNVTAAGTLATVNSNVGSFTYASIMVNAKGLITAASSGAAPTGTVTSVSLSAPLGGGTVTTSGTLGTTSYTNHGVLIGAGTSALSVTAAGGANTFLAGVASSDPTFRAPVLASADFANQGTTTTVLHGNAAGNPSFGAVSLTADVTGTLPVGNGGVGVATLTAHGVVIGNGASAVNVTGAGTSGQVLTSNGASADPTFQGFVGARAYNDGAQSIPNNTSTAVTFNSNVFDTSSIHSTSSNTSRLTMPTAGYWQFSYKISFNSSNTTGSRIAFIRKNGSDVIGAAVFAIPSATVATSCVNTFMQNAAASDFFEVFVFQNSGGAVTVGIAVASDTGEPSVFEAHRIGF
jgi:hypothetical protein